MKPPGEDELRSTVVELEPNRPLTDETDMGDLMIRVVHRLHPVAGGGTAITYRVVVGRLCSRGDTGPDDRATGRESGFLLWHVTLRWQRDVAAALIALGLTHVQFVLLASTWWFNSRDQQPSQAALAAHAGVDAKMTSQVIRTPERKGLISREDDVGDSRARRLVVTAAGSDVAPRAVEAVEAALLQRLPRTQARAFTDGLRQLRR
ncbi:MAG: MarR family winged helix-turn-helix transcriptional regulator [Geodermatophilaceae bacterium]